jgi:hypothetical protein
LFDDLRALADQLGILLPEDEVGKAKIESVMSPLLSLKADDLREARADKLDEYEDAARDVANDLAGIIAATFV